MSTFKQWFLVKGLNVLDNSDPNLRYIGENADFAPKVDKYKNSVNSNSLKNWPMIEINERKINLIGPFESD